MNHAAEIAAYTSGVKRARAAYRRDPITSPSRKCSTCTGYGYGGMGGQCGDCLREKVGWSDDTE